MPKALSDPIRRISAAALRRSLMEKALYQVGARLAACFSVREHAAKAEKVLDVLHVTANLILSPEPASVLRYVKMSISRDKIILDLSELKAEWDKKTAESDDDKLKENFGNYYNGIIGLPKWTEFNVSADDTRENILTISLSDKELSHV